MSILKLDRVSYRYRSNTPMVLQDVSLQFESGHIYAIVGRSGAGKTTLLSLLSSLTAPTGGTISLNDQNIAKIDRYKFRSQYVGVIFQNFNLLPHLTAVENVVLSMNISGKKFDRKEKEVALSLLEKVGLSKEEANRRVLQLSGGQQQRVAIARALSYDPDMILADEPTGNLDLETQKEIMNIFKMLAKEGKCVIIVTHSPDVAKNADFTYELKAAASSKS